jgi:hypothetical protein
MNSEETNEAPLFGEALAFYELLQENNEIFVVYRRMTNQVKVLNMWRGTWSQDISVLPVKNITDKIGIWEMPHAANAYVSSWILQKHPGLGMLSAAESEQLGEIGNMDDKDDFLEWS